VQAVVKREDFQLLAERRLVDVAVLMNAERFEAAYYLAGYAIECALKACVAKRTEQYDFPAKDSAKLYTHDIEYLMRHSGQQESFDQERASDGVLHSNWSVVEKWTESSRYGTPSSEAAEEMHSAIADPDHGVMACIRRYW